MAVKTASSTPTPKPVGPPRPPGPKGHWLTGNLREFRRDRLGFLTDCARTYGDVVAIRLGPAKIWVLNHPDLVEEVLVHKNRRFIKHFALRSARPSLGDGLLTSEGEFWRRQRRLAQPAFHRDRIASYGRVMVEYAERSIRAWADGQRRDAQADMMRLTLEIVVKTLFDADITRESAGLATAMETVMESFTDRMNRLIRFPVWLPVPSNLRFRGALRQVEGILYEIIAERRGGTGAPLSAWRREKVVRQK